MASSGKLRHKIIIQSQPENSDDFGEEVDSYNEVFKAKANVKIISGLELLKAGAASNKEIASILMRYSKRLQYDHLILFKGNHYEVASIKPDDKYMDMIVTASREVI